MAGGLQHGSTSGSGELGVKITIAAVFSAMACAAFSNLACKQPAPQPAWHYVNASFRQESLVLRVRPWCRIEAKGRRLKSRPCDMLAMFFASEGSSESESFAVDE